MNYHQEGKKLLFKPVSHKQKGYIGTTGKKQIFSVRKVSSNHFHLTPEKHLS